MQITNWKKLSTGEESTTLASTVLETFQQDLCDLVSLTNFFIRLFDFIRRITPNGIVQFAKGA